ncbi:putative coiled-coil domain-containing protein 195 [Pseudophryne corroboree]|uniref:putative coiled-coil domain-containing protein 195 n=1 Tax=Pseudophryne corroboree TaxID=495146 RepID=UPI003081C59D
MEGDTHLMRVIREMRLEINKLEKENKELRGELSQAGHKAITAKEPEMRTGIKCDQPGTEELVCPGVIRRNVSVGSADILQEQTGAAMTVRRYSMSSLLSSSDHYKSSAHMKRHSSTGTLELGETIQISEADNGQHIAKDKETATDTPSEKIISGIPKTRSFQEYMNKCRGRVKAVTFLLPMDMRAYAENQMTFQTPQNQSANHLSTIIEKDP